MSDGIANQAAKKVLNEMKGVVLTPLTLPGVEADLTVIIEDAIAESHKPTTKRCPLQEGREHLTEAGEFRSDKYPDSSDGILPLKLADKMAWPMIRAYADARESKDSEFTRDIHEALDNAGAPGGPNQPTTEQEE